MHQRLLLQLATPVACVVFPQSDLHPVGGQDFAVTCPELSKCMESASPWRGVALSSLGDEALRISAPPSADSGQFVGFSGLGFWLARD